MLAGERLGAEDGLSLYASHDVLAVGWLANYVRERMHGDLTYFNVNRHINPTNVCVAACKLCAFGRDGEINCGTTCSASCSEWIEACALKATAAAGSSFAG